MNLIEKIFDLMESDDCNTDSQASRLTTLYGTQDMDGQELLDAAFIALCGWSLGTLIGGK